MSDLPGTDIVLLWKRYLDGDAQALENILRIHYNLLYKYGKKFTPDAESVKDCIQDLFLFLWQNRNNISETPAVSNYLIKALRNRLRRHLSAKKLVLGGEEDFSFRSIPDNTASSEARLVSQEESNALTLKMREGIASLSHRQQEIIYLKFYLNVRPGEISEIMGIGRQSVYNLLNEAISRLGKIAEMHFNNALSLAILAAITAFLK
jgi:RNA polymerase sigma factor (sigma-70 family)